MPYIFLIHPKTRSGLAVLGRAPHPPIPAMTPPTHRPTLPQRSEPHALQSLHPLYPPTHSPCPPRLPAPRHSRRHGFTLANPHAYSHGPWPSACARHSAQAPHLSLPLASVATALSSARPSLSAGSCGPLRIAHAHHDPRPAWRRLSQGPTQLSRSQPRLFMRTSCALSLICS